MHLVDDDDTAPVQFASRDETNSSQRQLSASAIYTIRSDVMLRRVLVRESDPPLPIPHLFSA
jgi:hypothetical protein